MDNMIRGDSATSNLFLGEMDISLLETYAAVCQLIANLYRNILDEDIASRIVGISIDAVADDPVLSNANCLTGLVTMQSYCIELDANRLLQASNDFHDLFIGPHDLLAPPWSSVYLDSGKMIFGPSALAVKDLFLTQGFIIPEGNAEPSDHVAYEWQFMADMAKRVVIALRAGNMTDVDCSARVRAEFFASFLKPWMGPFCKKVSNGAKTNFYRRLSQFTQGFCALEAMLLRRFGVASCREQNKEADYVAV